MRCLRFLHGEVKEEDPVTMSASVRSISTTSTERDVRSGSDFTSLNVSDMSAESIRRTQYPSFTDRPSNLRVFSFAELKSATRNFSRSLMVGEGGFGCVYRGVIKTSDEPVEQVIFRDLKTSNILLDENWNAKLSDFGLARHGPTEGLTHVSTAVVGTLGYAAPEYMQTGRLTAKSDIWSYGVLLYELITGRRPIDRNRPKSEQKLLEWVKPYVGDKKRFPIIIDPRLEGHYNLKSMLKLSSVANRCLLRMPKTRPKMSEVYEMVQKIVDGVETGPPQPPLHYHGSVSEAGGGGKRAKKGSLKRRLQEFKLGCRNLVRRGWKP